MDPNQPAENSSHRDQQSTIPSINLPKGGGAIRGIGEKFQVNSVTGTASLNIPVYTTPGRSGFSPQLSLGYDSGNGNGPFGYGWQMGIDSISRKTSKGIPQYNDETDVFLLSDTEDLVPFLVENENAWIPLEREEGDFRIAGYRPRIEGLFSKIEKWKNKITGAIHWKTITKSNITSLYGVSEGSRIYDPDDENRVFQWLIEQSFDAKGNTIRYQYKRENTNGVNASLSYEGIRLKEQKSFNHLYLKSVQYGNKVAGSSEDFHFHVVLDYGDHDLLQPAVEANQEWRIRKDPFSRYTGGFELRQYRLCQRILLFHEFDELGDAPVLVRSLTMNYSETDKVSQLESIQQNGHKILQDGTIETKSFPPLSFNYSKAVINPEVKSMSPETVDNLPMGVDGNTYQWLDLEGEGVPGIFTEVSNAWYYKNNRGEDDFTAQHLIAKKPYPSRSTSPQPVFSDIDGDGNLDVLLKESDIKGYSSQQEMEWLPFIPFESYPVISQNNPDLKYIDLSGDGLADILISENEVFTWYPSKGKKGYGPPSYVRKALEEEKGPAILFSNPEQSIYLADMGGDGLNDIVRIRNGEVVYWPNKGYGHFGAKIIMENAPTFDFPEQFDQSKFRLFDIDGTGTTDILYVATDKVKIWYNQSGNSWSEEVEVNSFPLTNKYSGISVVDLLGKGTGCLVWSSPLPRENGHHLQYIDLMAEGKPYLMTSVNNNMGKETLLSYTSSTEFYLEDLKSGNPWITKLHFPVHVLKKVTVIDHISSSRLTTIFKYHHGYYDGEEREFRGFGMVEQTDSESFDTYDVSNELDMTPVHTKTWFHTGAYVMQEVISRQYADEYFSGDILAHDFSDSVIEGAGEMDYNHLKEAYRSLKGNILRQEIYSLDGTDQQGLPYSVTETNYKVQQLQPRNSQKFGVYLALGNESLTYAYERKLDDPRITHSILLETDAYGQPLKTVSVNYPRRSSVSEAYPEQQQLYITAQTNTYFNEDDDFYLLGVGLEQKGYELNGLKLATDTCFNLADLKDQLENVFAVSAVLSHNEPFTSGVQARLLSWRKNYFWDDENTTLPFGEVSALALHHHSEDMVMDTDWVNEVYGTKVNDAIIGDAGYLSCDGYWWNPGATIYYLPETSFYLPFKTTDAFGTQSLVHYDGYFLAAIRNEDALGNSISAEIDYRTLSSWKVIDINENVREVLTDAMGMVMATSVYGTIDGRNKGDSPVSDYKEKNNYTIDDIVANPTTYLQEATSFFYYNLEAWINNQQPPHFVSLLREKQVSELDGETTPIQIHLGYSDGFGRRLQKKVKVDNDEAGGDQWLVTGRTIYNNKEKPVKQYEPFYSDTYIYQDEAEVAPVGVTSIIYYDPLGRVIKTETPKGFHSEVKFDSWQVSTYDENDSIKDSTYYKEHIGAGDEEAEALQKAEAHYNTPSVVILDSLARQFMALQYLEEGGTPLTTYTTFDIQGNPLTIVDPRQYAANQSRSELNKVHNFQYQYDMVGNTLYTNSIDAGETWSLINVLGNQVHAWNSRGFHSQTSYDVLQRPVDVSVEGCGLNQIVQRMEYGDLEPDAADKNLKGQVVRHYDEAGIVEGLLFDINGQALASQRTFRADYKAEVNWNDITTTAMENETYLVTLEYDALGRIVKALQPDGSISQPEYHQSGWLQKVEVQLKKEAVFTSFVESIEYNAKGQRTKIIYGNGVQTSYFYEETTFRLVNLKTTRQEVNGTITELQDISYVYDPVGNIVKITDHSNEKVFTANQAVDAGSAFVYDALYQLKEATGREHLALTKTDYQQRSEIFKTTHIANINDSNQLRNYTRQYTYDDAGNLTQLKHIGENSFTRNITISDISNRAITDEMDHSAPVESYFDAAGNINQLEHLQGIEWNYRNNIASVTIIERDSENDSEYYVYDAAGQRIRKVKETYNSTGELLWKEEKIYLGGIEIKRKYKGSSQTLHEDRSALHVMDDKKRIAIVYYWTMSNDSSVPMGENKIHYQLGNHLGSASLELNASGQLISYEEYFPFGSTAFTAGSNATEVALKEYRYTGKEHDDTTGLYYYGARYYASWLGRWLSPDPAGTVDGLNVFRYVGNNPLLLVDRNGLESEEEFNAGELISRRRIDGLVYAEYRAKEDTWISASTLEQGWNEYFSKELGYGAYSGIVLDINGEQWQNTDLVKSGQRYLIPVVDQEDFILEPVADPPPLIPVPIPEPETPEPPTSNRLGKLVSLVIDTVILDKVTLEVHGDVGASGSLGGGIEGLAGPTLALTLITNPVSPDFLKAAVNISEQVSVGIKGGEKVEGGFKGGGGVSLTLGEYTGDSSDAIIESLSGVSATGAFGIEGQLIGGLQGSFVGSYAPASLPNPSPGWFDGGIDVSGFAGLGAGISAKIAGGLKYTEPAWKEADLLPSPLRSLHQWFYQKLQ